MVWNRKYEHLVLGEEGISTKSNNFEDYIKESHEAP